MKIDVHCVKSVTQSFSGPYFPAFGLNTDQKNSEYGHFSRSCINRIVLVLTADCEQGN